MQTMKMQKLNSGFKMITNSAQNLEEEGTVKYSKELIFLIMKLVLSKYSNQVWTLYCKIIIFYIVKRAKIKREIKILETIKGSPYVVEL